MVTGYSMMRRPESAIEHHFFPRFDFKGMGNVKASREEGDQDDAPGGEKK